MKTSRILALLVVILALSLMSGCSTSADSLLEVKLLSNARAYVGKGAEKVEMASMIETTTRAAIVEKVITTSDEVTAQRSGF